MPEKRTPKLTTLLSVDHAEINMLCSDHDSKQTKRGFSTLAAVDQKLSTIAFLRFSQFCIILTLSSTSAERGALLPFIAREDFLLGHS